MKAATLFLIGALALGGSTAAQAAFSPVPSSQDGASAGSTTAPIVLAKNGADNAPGDDHGGQGGKGGKGRGGHDDGAHHH